LVAVVPKRERRPNELLRKARGAMSQAALADLVNAEILRATGRVVVITSKSISDWERGWYTWPAEDVRLALCQVLGAAGPADLGFYRSRITRTDGATLAARVEATPLPELVRNGSRDEPAGVASVVVPSGRSYVGVELAVHHLAAEVTDREWVAVDPSDEVIGSLRRPDRRTLLIASDLRGDQPRQYVSDGRRFAGRADRRTGPQPVPTAHLLDDLTVGIIWAITNTDAQLQGDDAQLEMHRVRMTHYEDRSSSAAMLSEVPDLGTVSRQWLGSSFCSRHIMRHFERLSTSPLFWTREQRGEEAASWLIWSHKLDYLRRTSRWFGGTRRGFCIPAYKVSSSPRYERVLLLLAMALMEAFGIQVEVTAEPALGEVEGFVLADEVIVADWLGAPGLWYVDVGAPLSRLSTYREIDAHLAAESLIAQPTPSRRLEALADYLEVPWSWFRGRCRELAASGVDGVAHPRSRLLSTKGLDAAIRYVAYVETIEGADLARR